MKKRFMSVCLVTIIAVCGLLLSACNTVSYGDPFNTKAELKSALSPLGIEFLFPTYLGNEAKEPKYSYIATKGAKEKNYGGYKIYNEGTPFFVAFYGIAKTSDKDILSDDMGRLKKEESVDCARGEIKIYSGAAHEDSLFLIGAIVIDGIHYECRVNADKKTENNSFIHAIRKNNEYYPKAIDVIKKTIEEIE